MDFNTCKGTTPSKELRTSLTALKKAQQIFLELSAEHKTGIHHGQLATALSKAMDRNIPQDIVDSTLQALSAEEDSDDDSDLEIIGIFEFIAIVDHLKDKFVKLDSESTMTKEDTNALLAKVSNDLHPMRKLLRIQINGEDAKLVKSGVSHHDDDFVSAFDPSEMHILALVSHNEMKASMKRFVIANRNVLKKFRLTGTNSTMTMLKEVFKGDPDVVFGPSCSSGPLGGDAELAALMTQGCVGGIIFFQDPMSAHPHQADIESLCRLALVHNTMISHNPTTALMMMDVFRTALKGEGRPALMPSFFFNLMSPSVPAYKAAQKKVIQSFADEASEASTRSGASPTTSRLALKRKNQIVKLVHVTREKKHTTVQSAQKILPRESHRLEEYIPCFDSAMSMSSLSMSATSNRTSNSTLSELLVSLRKRNQTENLTSAGEASQLGEVTVLLSKQACTILPSPSNEDCRISTSDSTEVINNTKYDVSGSSVPVPVPVPVPTPATLNTPTNSVTSTESYDARNYNFGNHRSKPRRRRRSLVKRASLMFRSCRPTRLEV